MIIQTQFQGIYAASSSNQETSAQQYKEHVEEALGKIASGPSGYQLIRAIGSVSEYTLRKLTIQEISAEDRPSTEPVLSRSQVEKYQPETFQQNTLRAADLAASGEGCNAIIKWSPEVSIELTDGGSPVRLHTAAEESFVVLGHELVHARHLMEGTSKAYSGGHRYDETTPAGKEELRAVGLGKYRNLPSENSIRAEHNLPLRSKYQPRNS